LGVGPHQLVHQGLYDCGARPPAPSTVDVQALHLGDLEITALLLAALHDPTCASLAHQVNLPAAGTRSVLHRTAGCSKLRGYGDLRRMAAGEYLPCGNGHYRGGQTRRSCAAARSSCATARSSFHD
ncbi:unnamed protein product, partial [Ectocarpus sp. 12 AP-2014]